MTEPLIEPKARGTLRQHRLSSREKVLVVLFLLTLPLVNPWVRGDGVGYYAYVRSLLIDRDLRFEDDYMYGNSTFVMSRVDANGRLRADLYTSTGYVTNNFSVGPSMLWAPFLVVVHGAVLGLNRMGAHVPADGFSRPYLVTMALATAGYGFVGLLLTFRLARKYFEERWAFLATLGIWFASSLPVYMYFNPSWSHAHSVFAVGCFLWYWDRTRGGRTLAQWILLGALAGLMINVYYINGVLVLVPGLEALGDYTGVWRQPVHRGKIFGRLLSAHLLFGAVTLLALLPTFITRQIIYGSPLKTGYPGLSEWFWTSPALWDVLASSDHGVFSWTPLLFPAVVGLFLWWRQERKLAGYLVITSLAFYYLIASRPGWDGLSSFGNRFFISLTPIFILGLAALLERVGNWFASERSAFVAVGLVIALFVFWNLGFIFQWGTHLVPARGPISWRVMIRNQVVVVPVRLTHTLKSYLLRRKALMEHIEQEDLQQLQSQQPERH
jgi:hypothetical protein